LLAAGGYNQTTSDAEDFEDIYEDLEYKIDKLQELENGLQRKTAEYNELEETITEANNWMHKYAEQQRKLDIATKALKTIANDVPDTSISSYVNQALEQIGAENDRTKND